MKLEGRHLLLAFAVALVVGGIGGGLYIMGSPAAARTRRLDERRLQDLRAISSWVDVYWSRHSRLPESLDELRGQPGMVDQIRDPISQVQYEYSATGPKQYRLCAVFAGNSTEPANFWSHSEGRQCFDVEVNQVFR
jgi:hypothetical protein